jgi:hypothetical protein
MFYRQRRLVIDGKYSSDDGLSTTVKMAGSECACEDSAEADSEVKAQEEQRRGARAQQSSRYRSSQKRRKTEIHSCWISFRNPVSRQIGQELHEVYHREKPR